MSGPTSQTDLLKILAAGGNTGIGGGMAGGLPGLGGLAAATQARQNGSQLMRQYEALLAAQGIQSQSRPQPVIPPPGPTRRRKKKRRRQPDMPKKACTPFMHFCAYFKRKLMEEGKEFPQFADFGKRAGELWRNMGDVEKQQFVELSEKDRQRYIKDMKEYEERKLAEKERERELQVQRDKELQVLREKELEKLQKQQREQMQHQQKQMENHQKQQSQNPNPMMNMINPLNPLMMTLMNQSLMQTMMANPELMKSVYSEAARNYYLESLKNFYQNPNSPSNGNSVPVSSSNGNGGINSLVDLQASLHSQSNPPPNHMTSNPLASMGMNLNLLSLMASGQLSAVPTSTATSISSTSPRGSSPPHSTVTTSKPLLTPKTSFSTLSHHLSANSLVQAALDLSSGRPTEGRGTCSSDEENY
ncbi:unnamed protein product [Meganyctiphanes norvegica]|uniref:HMG box domain-containing protein n=1 Tax=Meganyctiphanes norvegica TaxID=48144 RepID=A0AAV2R470_MEGNR